MNWTLITNHCWLTDTMQRLQSLPWYNFLPLTPNSNIAYKKQTVVHIRDHPRLEMTKSTQMETHHGLSSQRCTCFYFFLQLLNDILQSPTFVILWVLPSLYRAIWQPVYPPLSSRCWTPCWFSSSCPSLTSSSIHLLAFAESTSRE